MLPSLFSFATSPHLQFNMRALIPVLIKSRMLTHCLCLNNRGPLEGLLGMLRTRGYTHTRAADVTLPQSGVIISPNYTSPIFPRVKLQLCVAVAQSNWLCPDLTGGTSERWAYHALPVTAKTNNWVLIVHKAAWLWKGRVSTTDLWPFKTNYDTCHWLGSEEINAVENAKANKRKINICLRPSREPEGFVNHTAVSVIKLTFISIACTAHLFNFRTYWSYKKGRAKA